SFIQLAKTDVFTKFDELLFNFFKAVFNQKYLDLKPYDLFLGAILKYEDYEILKSKYLFKIFRVNPKVIFLFLKIKIQNFVASIDSKYAACAKFNEIVPFPKDIENKIFQS